MSTQLKKIVANNIKNLRLEFGWTQCELSKTAKINNTAICIFEKGVRLPCLTAAIKLSNAFNISLNELLSLPFSTSEHQKAHIFYTQFAKIKELSISDQKLLKNLIQRLIDSGEQNG